MFMYMYVMLYAVCTVYYIHGHILCMYIHMYLYMYISMYVCMTICIMYVCMFVCMYDYMYHVCTSNRGGA